MEFHQHQNPEQDDDEEEEEEEEEDMRPAASTSAPTNTASSGAGGEASGSSTAVKKSASVRYRECLKNHAVGIGGHAVDGCGEFMAAGEEGSLDALKCAACNCHRNFHRKEVNPPCGLAAVGDQLIPYHHPPPPPPPPPQFSPYSYRGPPPPPPAGYIHFPPAPHRPLALPAAAGSGGGGGGNFEEDASNPSSSGGGGGRNTSSKKRHRTKFTAEQKEMMRRFSERVGWRIQKHDEAAVEEFCRETGVKRKVLKVWMHNNKHTIGNKEP